MAGTTKIEWTDATWNPITGCTLVSQGCKHCYAAELAATRLKNHPSRAGLARKNAKGVAQFTGEVRFNEQWLHQPLRWRKPRMIFVCAHGDLFHEDVPDEWIDRVFAVMALCPQHTFQVLTKRPERMRAYMSDGMRAAQIQVEGFPLYKKSFFSGESQFGSIIYNEDEGTWHMQWPLPNVWLGTSFEDQNTANDRIPLLLRIRAAVHFVSAEPLLGPVNLMRNLGGTLWMGGQRGCGGTHRHEGRAGDEVHGVVHETDPRRRHHHHDDRCKKGLDWVIVGGESGANARPMHPDWARRLREQCGAANVPFFFKQWGNWAPGECVPGSVTGTKHDATWWANEWAFDQTNMDDPEHKWDDPADLFMVGKKDAGRLLDGVTHDGMPSTRDGGAL